MRLNPVEHQFATNIIAYCEYLHVDISELSLYRVSIAHDTIDDSGKVDTMSEVIFSGPVGNLVDSLHRADFTGKLPFPHAGYELNYRQNVTRWSLQVNIDLLDGCSMDIDRWNPNWGLFPAVMHIGEVIYDTVCKTDTDPFDVAKALRKKGIKV